MLTDGLLRGAGDMKMFTVANLVNLAIRVIIAVTLAPVSYTHLDVYKRQGQRCCPQSIWWGRIWQRHRECAGHPAEVSRQMWGSR